VRQPLSIFAKGLENAMTRSFEIGVVGIDVRGRPVVRERRLRFFPAPDLLYVVRVVLSLVALLFGFDQIQPGARAGNAEAHAQRPRVPGRVLLGNGSATSSAWPSPFSW